MKKLLSDLMPLLALLLLMLPSLVLAAGGSMALGGLMELLIYIVAVGLIFWCIWWALGQFAIPEPFNKVSRVVLGLVALIIVINLLLGLLGTPFFTFR